MDILPRDAVKHIPLIILGIWPVNLLTLWAQGHSWGWAQTPPAIMGLWEWGLFVSLSLAILTELGVKMFIALAERRRKLNQALAEGIAKGRAEGRAEGITEGRVEGVAEGRVEGWVEGIAEGRVEGRVEGIAEGMAESRRETAAILDVLNAAVQTNPDLLPHLLQEYRARYQNHDTGQ